MHPLHTGIHSEHTHRLPAWHSTPSRPWRDIRMSENWSSNEKKSHLSFMILITLAVGHHIPPPPPPKKKNPFQRKFTNLLPKPALESTQIQFGTFSLLMNDPCCSSTDPQLNILMEKSVFTPFFLMMTGEKMKWNAPGWQESEQQNFLAEGRAYKTIFWPAPSVEEVTIDNYSWKIVDLIFCIHGTPLLGHSCKNINTLQTHTHIRSVIYNRTSKE